MPGTFSFEMTKNKMVKIEVREDKSECREALGNLHLNNISSLWIFSEESMQICCAI